MEHLSDRGLGVQTTRHHYCGTRHLDEIIIVIVILIVCFIIDIVIIIIIIVVIVTIIVITVTMKTFMEQ